MSRDGADSASLQIVAVALRGGHEHEHVTGLLWEGASSSGVITSEALIAWLRGDPAHEAWLADGEARVSIEVVTPIGAPAYLRSRAEGRWGDHLLVLPRF